MSAKFISHKDEHLLDLAFAVEKALTECGLDAQNFAQDKFLSYSWTEWSTSRTLGGISFEVEMNGATGVMIVGTDTEYSPYIEHGTGIYADNGGGRQTLTADEKHRTKVRCFFYAKWMTFIKTVRLSPTKK